MPFKSQAQRRKFAQLLVEGKISNETYEEWNRETGGAKLPERVGRTAGAKVKARPKAKPKARPKAKARARTRVKAKRTPVKAARTVRRSASRRKTK
jgi:hypothetical protein